MSFDDNKALDEASAKIVDSVLSEDPDKSDEIEDEFVKALISTEQRQKTPSPPPQQSKEEIVTIIEKDVFSGNEESFLEEQQLITDVRNIQLEPESKNVEEETIQLIEDEPLKEPSPEPIQVIEEPLKEPSPEPIQLIEEPIKEPSPEPIQLIEEPIKEPSPEPIKEPSPEPIQLIEEPIREPSPEPIHNISTQSKPEIPIEFPREEPIVINNPVQDHPIQIEEPASINVQTEQISSRHETKIPESKPATISPTNEDGNSSSSQKKDGLLKRVRKNYCSII